jgi:hypothetical protein
MHHKTIEEAVFSVCGLCQKFITDMENRLGQLSSIVPREQQCGEKNSGNILRKLVRSDWRFYKSAIA